MSAKPKITNAKFRKLLEDALENFGASTAQAGMEAIGQPELEYLFSDSHYTPEQCATVATALNRLAASSENDRKQDAYAALAAAVRSIGRNGFTPAAKEPKTPRRKTTTAAPDTPMDADADYGAMPPLPVDVLVKWAEQIPLTMGDVQYSIANRYGMSVARMLTSEQLEDGLRPRDVAIYVTQQLMPRTQQVASVAFHCTPETINNACRRIEARMGNNPRLRQQAQYYMQMALEGADGRAPESHAPKRQEGESWGNAIAAYRAAGPERNDDVPPR